MIMQIQDTPTLTPPTHFPTNAIEPHNFTFSNNFISCEEEEKL